MSGGSWEYVCYKIGEAGRRLQGETCPYRRALSDVVLKLAKVMHDIEWVDSCDMADGDDVKAIKEFMGREVFPVALSQLDKDAEKLAGKVEEIRQEIAKAEAGQ